MLASLPLLHPGQALHVLHSPLVLLLATPEELSLLFHLFRFYISLTQEASLSCIRALVAQMVKNLPTIQETQVQSQGWEDLLEKGMATH